MASLILGQKSSLSHCGLLETVLAEHQSVSRGKGLQESDFPSRAASSHGDGGAFRVVRLYEQ